MALTMMRISSLVIIFFWLGCLLSSVEGAINDDEDSSKVVHLSTFFDASQAPPPDYMNHDNRNRRLLFQQRVQADRQDAMRRRFLALASESSSTFEKQTATELEIVDESSNQRQHRNKERGRRTRSSAVRRRKTQEEDIVDQPARLETPPNKFENRPDATGRVNRNYMNLSYEKVDDDKHDKKDKPKKDDGDSVDYQSVSVPYADGDDRTGYEDTELPFHDDENVDSSQKHDDGDDDVDYKDVSVPYYSENDDDNVGYGDVSVPEYGHGYDVVYGEVSSPGSKPSSKGNGNHPKGGGDDNDGGGGKGKVGAKKGGDDDDDEGKGKGGKGKGSKGEEIHYPTPKGDIPHYPTPTPDCSCAGRPQCHCNGGSLPDGFEYEFAMVRDEVGTPDPGTQFRIASTLGINGYIHEVIHSMGQISYNQTPIGVFTGVCTVTGYPSDMLCTYEIVLYTDTQNKQRNGSGGGYNGFGGVVAHGPVSGKNNVAIITATEFDFDIYHRGSLALKQDSASPVLYATLKLYGYV